VTKRYARALARDDAGGKLREKTSVCFGWRKSSKNRFANRAEGKPGQGWPNIPAPASKKFFAPLFYKKAAACLT
jgi:hypothetical protein